MVSAYAGDPTNAPEWYTNIVSVDWETSPPARTGSRVAFVAPFMATAMRRANRKALACLKRLLEAH